MESPEEPEDDGGLLGSIVGDVKAAMGLLDGTVSIRQATSAYRQRMVEDEGFDEAVAAAMAVDFHRMAMAAWQAKLVGAFEIEAAKGLAEVQQAVNGRRRRR